MSQIFLICQISFDLFLPFFDNDNLTRTKWKLFRGTTNKQIDQCMNNAPLYRIGSLAYAPGSVQGLFSSLITTCLPASPLKNWSIMLVSDIQTLFLLNLFQFASLWFGIQPPISCTLLLLFSNCKSEQNFQLHQYSQVPFKQVGSNKRVGWVFWVNFIKE